MHYACGQAHDDYARTHTQASIPGVSPWIGPSSPTRRAWWDPWIGENKGAGGDSKSAEEGGLWVAVRVAIVQGAVWGVPWCLRGRSNFKNHHSHTCKTTSASLSVEVAPAIPPPRAVWSLYALFKRALRLSTTSAQTPPQPHP